MENIIKKLRKSERFKCVLSITGLYFKIEIRDKLENRLKLVIYCNFNKKRNSFSYIEYRNQFDKRSEKYVSKQKLNDVIDNLIKKE